MKTARIIVIVVIALVAGAVWFWHCSRHAVRGSVLAAAEMTTLRQIGLACRVYAEEHQGQFPTEMPDVTVVTNFGYVRGATTASPPDTVIAYRRPHRYGKHTGGLIHFADGGVSWESADEFEKVLNEPVTNGMARPRRPLPSGGGYD